MNIAFLLAAGKSTRFGKDKLFELIKGKPVILWSLEWMEQSSRVSKIFIAASAENKNRIKKLISQEKFSKVEKIILGGQTRFRSVLRLLTHAKNSNAENFVIHNAANPLATGDDLEACFALLQKDIKGVAVGRKITSTVKNAPDGIVKVTVPREDLWEMETPQVVRAKDFMQACSKFANQDFSDDLSVFEVYGKRTAVVSASAYNRKITSPADLETLKIFVGDFGAAFSVGIGEDSHKFMEYKARVHKKLILGGVKFSKYPALKAESDGDVMIHALCNAISSALGSDSLGTYATEMRKNGIRDSREYLKLIIQKMERKQRKISQCSFSIEAARPTFDPIAPEIKKNLSELFKISTERIGITATSGEGLTPFGRGEAIKCTAIVLIC